MRALLDNAGAFAVVLADDDQRAADHAGRRQIRQRVCRHIGADDGLPGHDAAQRIVDAGAKHGCCSSLVRAGFDMDAEFGELILRFQHHVEQMAHRRALIAADVGNTRLEQGLRDGDDALALEGLAIGEFQAFYFYSRTYWQSESKLKSF